MKVLWHYHNSEPMNGLIEVSKMLGHTSIKTTQIYARIVDSKLSDDMETLKLKLEYPKLSQSEISKRV